MNLVLSSDNTLQLFTIGYATKPLDIFIQQLKRYQINVIADVRSVPYSKVFHEYHRESIQQHLHSNNIRYVYVGEELGPRSKNPEHYDENDQVQFDRLMQSDLFQQGIERLRNGLNKGYRIALMCAEKDPACCHRSLLIGYYLSHLTHKIAELDVQHISHNGELETQDHLEQRLCEIHELTTDLFMSSQERLHEAYQKQLRDTSYRKAAEDTC